MRWADWRLPEPDGMIPLGLIGVGLAALFVPRLAAKGFGVDAPEGDGRAYLYAAGVRDIFIGLAVGGLVLRGNRREANRILGLSAIIPLFDAAIVASRKGLKSPQALGHLSSAASIVYVTR